MPSGNLKLLAGSSNIPLSKEIADFVGCPLTNATVTSFPDGESCVQINENIRGEDVFIIQSTHYPANHNIMELLIIIDAVRRASASRITAVMPFFGYARQDRKDKPRVPITSKLVANLLVAAGTDRVLAMDLHTPQLTGFFDIPVDHLFAAPVFHDYFQEFQKDNLTVVSPDIGGLKMAAAYADMLGCPFGIIAKRRIDAEDVHSFELIGEVKDRDVLIVDDMTESGGTLCEAAKLVKAKGAKSVQAAISHGVLNEKGYARLKEGFKEGFINEVVTTNSTPVQAKGLPIKVLSVAHLLGEAIMRIHHNESVTSLFKIKGY